MLNFTTGFVKLTKYSYNMWMNSSIKKIAIGILILSIILITFIILLSVWNIIVPYVLWKSIFTVIIVGLASFVVIFVIKTTKEDM